jgi:hypothetical protein
MDVLLYSGSENFEHSSQFHSAPHLIIFYKYKSYTTKMPRLSRQAKAAAARTRSPNSNRFIDLKKVAENDEYYDMDDDDPQFFHDIGEDEEADIIEDEIQEDEAVLSDEFLNQLRNWRPTGWNSNVRGAGTSRRTHCGDIPLYTLVCDMYLPVYPPQPAYFTVLHLVVTRLLY